MTMAIEHKMSTAQEKRTADRYRGSRTPGSGAGWKVKGDVRSDLFLIENKTRVSPRAASYTVKFTDLRDLTKRAILEERVPLLQFDLGGHPYVIMREEDLLGMFHD